MEEGVCFGGEGKEWGWWMGGWLCSAQPFVRGQLDRGIEGIDAVDGVVVVIK